MAKSGSIKESKNLRQALFSSVIVALVLSGCATTEPEGAKVTVSKEDPYENVNRNIYVFNDKLDTYFAEPISDAYKWITPQFLQTGITNFFNNLKNVNVVINDVLQGKLVQSAHDFGRLTMNTTFGVGGLFDVAKNVGLEQNDEDFDQTLGVWGVPKGSYLVLPVLGPTTVRGIPGAIFDAAANPSNYVGAPVQLLSLLNTRANAQGLIDASKEGAIDPYVFTREGFLQNREYLTSDGKSSKKTDVDIELEGDEPDNTGAQVAPKQPPSKTSPASVGETKPKYTLRLSSDGKGFDNASHSFGGVTRAFDSTSLMYDNMNYQLDRAIKKHKPKLKKARKH